MHIGGYAGQYFFTLNFGKTPKQPGESKHQHKSKNQSVFNSRYMQNFAPEYANSFKNMQTQTLYNQPYNS